MICKNCGHSFESKYCPDCGQSSEAGRFTLKEIFNELLEIYFKLKHGLFHTIKELTIHPAQSIKNYLHGERGSIYNPLKYLFITVLVNTFLILKYHLYVKNGFVVSGDAGDDYVRFYHFYMSNLSLLDQLIVPFVALFSFLFFRKDKYNYAENVIINCYLIAHYNLLNIILVAVCIIFKLNYDPMDDKLMALYAIFQSLVYINIFSTNKIIGFIKSLLLIISANLLYFEILYFIHRMI